MRWNDAISDGTGVKIENIFDAKSKTPRNADDFSCSWCI